MRIAVASGKGGTGKTLISTSLARLWSDSGHRVTYVDGDVEEPNGHLFLSPTLSHRFRFQVRVPTLHDKRCAAHGKCQEICAFNAILSMGGQVTVFHELCHSCGACLLACPDHALGEVGREMGTISTGAAGHLGFVSGSLDVGEVRAAPLIDAVVAQVRGNQGLTLIDAPPGTSCSVLAAVRGADLLLLVTEPTPFGLHDLKLAIGMGRVLGHRILAVINRCDLGDDRDKETLALHGIPILAEIPFDRAVAEAYSAGRLPMDESDMFKASINQLGRRLLALDKEAV